MRKSAAQKRFSQVNEVNNVKLHELKIGNDLVCEVTADYPLIFSITPRLNNDWLRGVMASAINGYLLRRRNKQKRDVVTV